MDCAEASERLPWLLHGSLPEPEAGEVRSHLEACAGCREDLARTREVSSLFDAHVPRETLADLAWGAPPAGPEDEVVRRHLESCADCAEELALAREGRRALRDAPAAARPDLRVTRLAVAAGVAVAFGAGLLAGRIGPTPPETHGREAALEREVTRLRGASERAAALERQLEGLLSPRANLPVVELLPRGFTARGGEPAAGTVLRDGPFVAVSLVYDSPRPSEAYRLDLVDAAGSSVWRADGLVRQPAGDFSLLIPVDTLRDGPHELRLAGLRQGAWVPLASYGLRVEPAR